jgi:hypothetical protein
MTTKRLSEIGNVWEWNQDPRFPTMEPVQFIYTPEERRELVREVVRRWCSYEWQLSTINGQIAWIEEFIKEQGL